MKHHLVLLALLIGCSSSPKYGNKEHEHIQKDYIVRDASSNFRPGWIEDANGWAKKENDRDIAKTHISLLKLPRIVIKSMAVI